MTEDESLSHLLSRAVIVEQRVRRAVSARQETDPDPDDAFRGLYLSDGRVQRLLDDGRRIVVPEFTTEPAEPAGPTRLSLVTMEFDLTELDTEILLIALIPDLDDRFEAFYGYLNDDVTRRRPSVGLALGLCGLSAADAGARGRLGPSAPLRAGGLLLVEEGDRPLLSRELRVPDRVTSHLLGDDTPAPRIADLLAPWHDVR
ncbi:ATP-binding protein, partial [Streptomyces syringium]